MKKTVIFLISIASNFNINVFCAEQKAQAEKKYTAVILKFKKDESVKQFQNNLLQLSPTTKSEPIFDNKHLILKFEQPLNYVQIKSVYKKSSVQPELISQLINDKRRATF